MNQNDVENCKRYINKTFQRDKNNYSALILESVYNFSIENNPAKALKTVMLAEKVKYSDCTWKYNKAFLLMFLNKYEKALALYYDIEKNMVQREEIVLDEVLKFNENLVRANATFCQSYFILGFLYYKKDKNFPKALENFEKFQKSKCYKNIPVLNFRTVKYIKELKDKMEL